MIDATLRPSPAKAMPSQAVCDSADSSGHIERRIPSTNSTVSIEASTGTNKAPSPAFSVEFG